MGASGLRNSMGLVCLARDSVGTFLALSVGPALGEEAKDGDVGQEKLEITQVDWDPKGSWPVREELVGLGPVPSCQ